MFREREMRETLMCEREKCIDRLRHMGTWPATQACALTGNRTCNISVHRPVLSSLSYTNQGSFMFRGFYTMYYKCYHFIINFSFFFGDWTS